MGAQLIVTTAETKPDITSWKPINWVMDRIVPYIKVTFQANTGEQRLWLLVPSEETPATQIRAGLKYINEGKYATEHHP